MWLFVVITAEEVPIDFFEMAWSNNTNRKIKPKTRVAIITKIVVSPS